MLLTYTGKGLCGKEKYILCKCEFSLQIFFLFFFFFFFWLSFLFYWIRKCSMLSVCFSYRPLGSLQRLDLFTSPLVFMFSIKVIYISCIYIYIYMYIYSICKYIGKIDICRYIYVLHRQGFKWKRYIHLKHLLYTFMYYLTDFSISYIGLKVIDFLHIGISFCNNTSSASELYLC